MSTSTYIEDIFLEFYDLVDRRAFAVQHQDISVTQSFYLNLINGNQLTENQAKFILKILYKYRNLADSAGLNYLNCLDTPVWKNSFRVIDNTKKIFVETDENNKLWACVKFPYQLKKKFDEEICHNESHSNNIWDSERKLRRLSVNDFNIIQLFEFVKEHSFEIDETFLGLVSAVEEIWQEQEKIQPYCKIVNNEVTLVNAVVDAEKYWNENKTDSLFNNLMLAKSMGFLLADPPASTIEKIAATDSNMFWIKSNKEFLEITKQVDGKVCIVLDRVGRTVEWLNNFAKDLDESGIDHSLVKVCFRENKTGDQELNAWIKENKFGGSVADGKILIFNHKPSKWLFKESNSVKILASNNLYPSTNQISRDWFTSHPCVIYIGDIKPSQNKEQKIVNL